MHMNNNKNYLFWTCCITEKKYLFALSGFDKKIYSKLHSSNQLEDKEKKTIRWLPCESFRRIAYIPFLSSSSSSRSMARLLPPEMVSFKFLILTVYFTHCFFLNINLHVLTQEVFFGFLLFLSLIYLRIEKLFLYFKIPNHQWMNFPKN
jgi:hypothetical protein